MDRYIEQVEERFGPGLEQREQVKAALPAAAFSIAILFGVAAGIAALVANLVGDGFSILWFVVGYVGSIAVIDPGIGLYFRVTGRLPGAMWVTVAATNRALLVFRNSVWTSKPVRLLHRIDHGQITAVTTAPRSGLRQGVVSVEFASGDPLRVLVAGRIDPAPFADAFPRRTQG